MAAYTLGKDLKSCTYTLKFLCLMVGRQASHQYDTTKLLLILKPQNNSAIIFYLCFVVSNSARLKHIFMLSKVKIDLNERNEPVIIVEWQPSDDLRDKVVKQFIEGFGFHSNEAVMTILNTDVDFKRICIAPVLKENPIIPVDYINRGKSDLRINNDKIGFPANLD